jgi:molybdopterin/thiamine biosynthesis adenylyltransferase
MAKIIRQVALFPDNVYVIGAGGVASYLLPPLLKVLRTKAKDPPTVTIFDQDKLTKRNLDRQVFQEEFIGKFKAEALAETLKSEYPKLGFEPIWFHSGVPLQEESLLFCCVDNHPARKAALDAADQSRSKCIIAANEYTDSQAYYYEPGFVGTSKDPRVRYEDISTDKSDDPIRPVGCAGEEAIKSAPQLAIANDAAANYALQLMWFHFVVRNTLDRDTEPHWPLEHSNNFNKLKTRTYAEFN